MGLNKSAKYGVSKNGQWLAVSNNVTWAIWRWRERSNLTSVSHAYLWHAREKCRTSVHATSTLLRFRFQFSRKTKRMQSHSRAHLEPCDRRICTKLPLSMLSLKALGVVWEHAPFRFFCDRCSDAVVPCTSKKAHFPRRSFGLQEERKHRSLAKCKECTLVRTCTL